MSEFVNTKSFEPESTYYPSKEGHSCINRYPYVTISGAIILHRPCSFQGGSEYFTFSDEWVDVTDFEEAVAMEEFEEVIL